jgi:AAA15 family ATPase/GTPase
MIIEFSYQNFRSFRDATTFLMKADAGKSKLDNTFIVEFNTGNSIQLLKTAVIYGANASGKSNFIRAFFALTFLIKNSAKFNIDQNQLITYEPYELDIHTINAPISFKIAFILKDIKYEYEIAYNKNRITYEKLNFSPKGQVSNIYTRIISEKENYDTIELGKNLLDKKINKKVFKNQLYLSKFGIETPHDELTPIFQYLSNINIWNAYDKFSISDLSKEIATSIAQPENKILKDRLSKLIRVSDTRIESIGSKELKKDNFKFPEEIPENVINDFLRANRFQTFAIHKLFDGKKEIGKTEFDFDRKESVGTQVLFALGGKILQTLENGGILVIDELDNSLHPKLCKFLIRLFNSKISNPKNAQLIFATHEVTLLDHDVFRKDQIWFVQKDKHGNSELYNAGDFEGIRDSTNFEVWYRTGKFGGNPEIKEIEFIYE